VLVGFDLDLLEQTAAVVVDFLLPFADADWSVQAGTLEWDVDQTIAHMAGLMAKHTLYLASQSPRFIPVKTPAWEGVPQRTRIDAITDLARGEVQVARHAPVGAIAYHVSGMQSAESYVAAGCEELLVHTYDVASGLDTPFNPSDVLCRPVLRTLHPDAAGDAKPWPTLLWLNNRPHPDTVGRPAAPPLDARDRTPLEFAQDPGTGEWRPTRWVEDQ
jgi:hypothetical protein